MKKLFLVTGVFFVLLSCDDKKKEASNLKIKTENMIRPNTFEFPACMSSKEFGLFVR